MSLRERLGGLVAHRSRLVVAALLLLTVVVGAGAGMVEESTTMSSLASDSTVIEKSDYVDEAFGAREGNVSVAMFAVRNDDGNVLSRDSLVRTLRFQRALRTNETVGETLVENRSTVGVANVVAQAAIRRERRAERASANATGNATAGDAGGRPADPGGAGPAAAATRPTLDEQIAQLESMSDAEVEAVVERLLAGDSDLPGRRLALRLLPRDYETGTATANARLVVVTQRPGRAVRTGASVPERIVTAQVAARDVAKSRAGPETYLAFGSGIAKHQQNEAISDSLSILGPAALLFIVGALAVVYRDPVDVALGLLGVVFVLVWTFGLMGYAGIEFSQMMIAVPILLIGLAVDYALHVVMRYREHRAEREGSVREAMASALGGVGPALVLVTLTTAIGFLANLTSSVPDIRLFGVVTAAGIGSTLVVFGALIPALKTEIDAALEARGYDRSRAAFGTGGRLGALLTGGASLARRAPVALLLVALLVTAGAGYAATDVTASNSEEMFMADDPPGWMESLPGPLQPGEFFLEDNWAYIYERFQSPDKQVHLLVEGAVTNPDTLERVAAVTDAARGADVTFTRADGEAAVVSPLTAMRRVAERDGAFARTLAAADADGDGVPDQNLERVYDAFYAAAPETASRYVHRTASGGYDAIQTRVSVVGTAKPRAVEAQLSPLADDVERGVDGVSAIAVGDPLVTRAINERLTTTVATGLGLTLAAVLALLVVVFRLRVGSASLGAVTLVPVAAAVAWLLGTMALLDIPLNLVTAMVGSIAVGLGVDYTIHVSERFAEELADGGDARAALERTMRGTGGALVSSAVTTAAGFGVLTLSLLPGLSQFGFVLAVGILYALAATVLVLPSLLVVWTRYGPAPGSQCSESVAAADD